MNDTDYHLTLECLRIAARLVRPLDLDGFVARVEALQGAGADPETLPRIRRLAKLAKAMQQESDETVLRATLERTHQ